MSTKISDVICSFDPESADADFSAVKKVSAAYASKQGPGTKVGSSRHKQTALELDHTPDRPESVPGYN